MLIIDEACMEQVLKESRGCVQVWVFILVERPIWNKQFLFVDMYVRDDISSEPSCLSKRFGSVQHPPI